MGAAKEDDQVHLQRLTFPRTKEELQRYNSFGNYNRNYILGLSEEIAAFHQLMKSNQQAKVDQVLITNFKQ